MFKCKNINVKYDDFELKNIGFELQKGNILGVIGRNGSGKTTLIKRLCGIEALKGDWDIANGNINLSDNPKDYKQRVAYIPSDTIFPGLFKPLYIGKSYGRYYDGFDLEKYKELLKKYKVPYNKSLQTLSKGEQIRQMLAFALSYPAEILFLDEPTGNLDVAFRDELYTILRELVAEENKTIIYASHMIEELEAMSDYLLWIRKNDNISTVKFFGSIDELREEYRMVSDETLLETMAEGNVIGKRKRDSNFEALIKVDDKVRKIEAMKTLRYADLKEIIYYEEKGEI